MSAEKIDAKSITRPIQLLAAWMIALGTIEVAFLGTAATFSPGWERSALIVAAILYVPMFIGAMIVLQTRFRSELLEDSYYSKIISQKTAVPVAVSRFEKLESSIKELTTQFQTNAHLFAPEPSRNNSPDWKNWKIALNTRHPKYREIKAQLETSKIPVAIAFGESAAPARWVVSINKSMPIEHAVKILRVVSNFDFDAFMFWEPIKEVGETEDVYIGSYGKGPYIPITPEFKKLISADIDEFKFSEYLIAHQVES